MAAFDHSSKRNHLLGLLQASEASDLSIRQQAQDLVGEANLSLEVNAGLQNVINRIPDDSALPPTEWDRLSSAWQTHRDNSHAVFSIMTQASTFSATSHSVSLSTSLAFTGLGAGMVTPALEPSVQALKATLHRGANVVEARALIKVLGLDKDTPTARSPLALLEDAHLAYARPPGEQASPTNVLIPLREAIEAALGALLLKRPVQEPTGKAVSKVISIGTQCGRDGLDRIHFHNLGVDAGRLLKELSGAKQGRLSIQQVQGYFDAGVHFLISFLGSLDTRRLRT